MSKSDGFLKGPVLCSKCKKELSGQDGPRPAETYLGTYTGLCYACEKSGPYIKYTLKLDNCRVWSYPPHLPSWRRDRETYYAYDDCFECYGKGVIGITGMYNRHSSCDKCMTRFNSHPKRQQVYRCRSALIELAERKLIKEYEKIILFDENGKKLRLSNKARREAIENLTEAQVNPIREPIMKWFQRRDRAMTKITNKLWETDSEQVSS